ncbi:MAG: iron-containing alcohol dehydrogenase, partial [Ruminiclostridium sp.]
MKNYIYMMPVVTLIGSGCINKLGIYMKEDEVKKSLIVTDSFMTKVGVSTKISNILAEQGIQSAVFEGVLPNPTIKIVSEAINLYLKESCDSIVSIGGGSAHDTAKALKLSLLKGGLS